MKYWEDHLKAGINIDIIFQHQTNQPTNKPTNQPTSTTNNNSQHSHWHFQHLNADGLHKYLRPWRRRYNAGICQSWQSKLARLWVCCVPYKDLSIKGLFHFKINLEGCVSEHLLNYKESLLKGSCKNFFFRKFSQMLVGGVADSQTRSKPPPPPPPKKNRLLLTRISPFVFPNLT